MHVLPSNGVLLSCADSKLNIHLGFVSSGKRELLSYVNFFLLEETRGKIMVFPLETPDRYIMVWLLL